ncbi:hypothetical protein EUX98_g6206 [Antrodiella citrinella]|uniref:HPt domain-containing protein n=1 Tax=Antrodiella citrinella TaxID=2447956 RepID=A0A4S4MPN6_9APHY|nr:hypothetical protein EUX98_g6206 [Antrodiella citrinella]
MSFSRAASEAPAVPPPRSPIHHATKESIRHTSPGPSIVPNGKITAELPPKSIASALSPVLLSPPPSIKPLVVEKERESSKPPVQGKFSYHHPTFFPSCAYADPYPLPHAMLKPQVLEPTPEPEPELESGEAIEMETFEQILELDEDDTHDFSYGMVVAYFSQASQTFQEMDDALKAEELEKLSQLGHFLKGSSAALGVAKVQATCEIIQHLGKMQEDDRKISQAEALRKLAPLLTRVKKEYVVAEAWLRKFYEEAGVTE